MRLFGCIIYILLVWVSDVYMNPGCQSQVGSKHIKLNMVNEDTYFTGRYDWGTILGVFDGHGGGAASKIARENFIAYLICAF